MVTLASQKFSVTLPKNAVTFLRKRAKRQKMSAPKTIAAIIMEVMEKEDESDALFYSESNMRALSESIAQAERGELIEMTFEELKAITNEAMAKLK